MKFIHPSCLFRIIGIGLLFVWFGIFLSTPAWAQTTLLNPAVLPQSHALKTEVFAKNLGIVWAMDYIDANRIIFTIRNGKAGVLDITSKKVSWLKGLPEVHNEGQGGLLDVAVPKPHSAEQATWIYFTYSKQRDFQGNTTLARAKLQGDKLTHWQDLLITQSASMRDIHYGSRIAFDRQGHVFFSVGDRGVREKAQDLSNHAGTIIRLKLDGSIPNDNPFMQVNNALPEIWSYGHRNPQGLFFDDETQRLWSIEHGPRGGDEINLIEKGQNYGWPLVSQGKEYFADIKIGVSALAGMQEAVKIFTPSIAPSDLMVYRGTLFQGWQGSLLSGALKLRHLNKVTLHETTAEPIEMTEERFLQALNERVRSLLQGHSGEIWLATDSGRIYRVTPN